MQRERPVVLLLPGVALAALFSVALLQPRFLSFENLGNVVRQAVPLAIFALAQMLPLLTRGLDLSQGGVVVATSVTFALLSLSWGVAIALPASLLVGLAAGFINGAIVGLLRVSPLVVTLGTGSVLSGLALVLSNGQPISDVPVDFAGLYRASAFGVPAPVIVTAVLFAVLTLMLARTVPGRFLYAVGSSRRASLLSGIPVNATILGAYAGCGLLTSLGAVFLASRISSGHPTVGSDSALQAVAAAVIGGVSLFGGRGRPAGVLLGAFFLALLANALNLLNVSSFMQMVAIGLAIIAAAVVDRWRVDRMPG